MYEVKEYSDGDKIFYGVYIKSSGNMYGEPSREEDNIVVLCKVKCIAEKIKNLLEKDNELEEYLDSL